MTENPPPLLLLLVCPENLSLKEAELARELAASGQVCALVSAPDRVGAAPPDVRVIGWRALEEMRPDWQPDFVVYASPPLLALHWKTWWWKRRRAPGALLGGFWRLTTTGTNTGQRRWGERLALDSLDFWLAEDEASAGELARVGVPRGRLLVTAGRGNKVETVPAFLERRRRAEERSVLWVDDDLSLKSPSTKHLLYSIPHLQALGWEVRGWCLSSDETARDGAEIREFPAAPRRLRLFTPYWFFAVVNLHGVVQTILKGRSPARVVHTVGSAYLGADIAAIHFVHHLWLRKQIELRPRSRKAVLELAWTFLAMLRDQLQYRNPRCRLLLPVSDSIAQAVRKVCRPDMEVAVLPNTYDETRFNPEVRAQWRGPTRRDLGYTEEDAVFCFASQGHYRRKGFWLAVDALSRLRARAEGGAVRRVRLLVVGGSESTLAGVRAELAQSQPGWEGWITFTGTQAQIERYLSAADAFLFPSYFEAFCLAEIENGALGVPLLLTPHPGTEMILRDGVNGWLLPYDPAKIVDKLATFLQNGLPPFAASPGRALTRLEYARELARRYDEILTSAPFQTVPSAHGNPQ